MTPPVEVTKRIRAPPEVVFRFLAASSMFQKWMGAAAVLEPHAGGRFHVQLTPRSGFAGRVVSVDPPHRIVFTWGYQAAEGIDPASLPVPEPVRSVAAGSTTVEVELEAVADGTLLRLRHRGLPSPQSGHAHGAGWTMYLGRLAAVCEGRDPGPDPFQADPAAAAAGLAAGPPGPSRPGE